MTFFKDFIYDESGATAVEYGLIAALIAIALIPALGTLEDDLTALFGEIETAVAAA